MGKWERYTCSGCTERHRDKAATKLTTHGLPRLYARSNSTKTDTVPPFKFIPLPTFSHSPFSPSPPVAFRALPHQPVQKLNSFPPIPPTFTTQNLARSSETTLPPKRLPKDGLYSLSGWPQDLLHWRRLRRRAGTFSCTRVVPCINHSSILCL